MSFSRWCRREITRSTKKRAKRSAARSSPLLFCGAHRTLCAAKGTRKMECGAKQFLACFVVRTAPFALLKKRAKRSAAGNGYNQAE